MPKGKYHFFYAHNNEKILQHAVPLFSILKQRYLPHIPKIINLDKNLFACIKG